MKRTKVILSIVLTSVLSLSVLLTGCKDATPQANNSRIDVVTTIFAPYDFTRQIAGDNADIILLVEPGSNVHEYSPTQEDIETIKNADIFVYVGGDSEPWINDVLNEVDITKVKLIPMLACSETVTASQPLGQGVEGEQYDEHVWTSTNNVKRVVSNITTACADVDPERGEMYRSNADKYYEELNSLDAEVRAVAESSARKVIVVGDQNPFRYFTQEYGLQCFSVFGSCSDKAEADENMVNSLIDKVQDEEIPVVFYKELSDQQLAQRIASPSEKIILELHSCEGVSQEDFDNGETFVSLMKKNVVALALALN